MMRSLYSGVAGLKTHQTKMDVIGNNIANVNTTSFKSQSITFSDLMYQTTQTASGATETKGGVNARQIGLGAKSGAINTAITAQGATQTTNNPFDIMITGESFFVVNNGTQNLYTRDGSFYVDGAGNLAMQSNGYLVQGWAAREDRETGEITINKGTLTGLQIMSAANYTYAPASTTSAYFGGNIDAQDTNLVSKDGKSITLEFYDNKGYLYTGKFTLKDTEPKDEHTYALTLTDIIDSNGKSINDNEKNYDLMSQVKFGEVGSALRNSQPTKTQTGYTVVSGSDSNSVTINKDGGDIKFNNVPASGKLVSLMSPQESGNSSFSNLLSNAYGLNDDMIKQTYPGWASADYEIASNGKITIISDVKNIPTTTEESATYDTVTFKGVNFTDNPNTDDYLINAKTQKAYKIPPASGDVVSYLTPDLLKDVFGITADYSSGYNFTYSDGALKIYQDFNPGSNTGAVTPEFFNKLGNFYNGTDSVQADINSYLSADSTHAMTDLQYTYGADGVLRLTQPNVVDGPATEILGDDVTTIETGLTEISNALSLSWGTSSAADASYADIAGIAALTPGDPSNTYSDVAITAAAAVKDMLDVALLDNTKFADIKDRADTSSINVKFLSVTGTNALSVGYTKTTTETVDFPGGTLKKYTLKPSEDKTTLDIANTEDRFLKAQPKYVFQNNTTFGTSYYVLDDKLEKEIDSTNLNVDFLKAVYPDSASDIDALAAELATPGNTTKYQLKISESGTLAVTHKEADAGTAMATDPKTGLPAYMLEREDGKFIYKTSQAYEDVPKTGKISDLLLGATAQDGKYADLLSKVYGINDKMAAAYGIDGTYEIDNTPGSSTFGQMILKTGDHTIQLKFNADDGTIATADNNKDNKVNITFGQGYPGLEAFGFQASPNNPAEQERAFTISVDFTTIHNYNTNGSSTITATKGDLSSLNTGRAVGEMNGVNVGTDGRIFATYSNGQTKLLGQIASAEFANASGLSKEGDNLYASTLNSGEATIQDITTDGGYMNTGVLEMSNVDLSSQFTEMITTQRGFQANSRIITVSDTLLEELTNLKR